MNVWGHVLRGAMRAISTEMHKRNRSSSSSGTRSLECQACGRSAGNMLRTSCCKVILCQSCGDEWKHAGGKECVICNAIH